MPDLTAVPPSARSCGTCRHRRSIPGDCHVACGNLTASVTAEAVGVANGWFLWPFNFDPAWLRSCDGYAAAER